MKKWFTASFANNDALVAFLNEGDIAPDDFKISNPPHVVEGTLIEIIYYAEKEVGKEKKSK